MRRIFAFGESLVDVIMKDQKRIAVKAGGSMLNALVSLGRLQKHAYLISEFANGLVDK